MDLKGKLLIALGFRCKFYGRCNYYSRNSRTCNENGGDYYGINQPAGCYRRMAENESKS